MCAAVEKLKAAHQLLSEIEVRALFEEHKRSCTIAYGEPQPLPPQQPLSRAAYKRMLHTPVVHECQWKGCNYSTNRSNNMTVSAAAAFCTH